MKPTYGRNSRYGLVAFASSLDQVGVFGRSTRDVATVLGVIAGRDPCDATTADVPVPDYLAGLDAGCKNLRLGFPRALFGEGLDASVRTSVEQAIETYRELGARSLMSICLTPGIALRFTTLLRQRKLLQTWPASMARATDFAPRKLELRQMYRKTRDEGFGAEVKRRIMLGTYVLSAGYYDAYYRKAQQVRALLKKSSREFSSLRRDYHATSPTPAFPLGEKVDDPLAMYLNDVYTVTANLAGVPGINVPCGLSADNLPIGFQLLGPYWSEATLFQLTHAYEQAKPFTARPPVHAD